MQSQVKFNGFRRRPGRLWCTARSGSTGFQRRFRKRSNLTWPCTKASQTSGIFRNHVELDLALHQSLRNLLRNLLWNPVGPDLALHQGFSGAFSGAFSGTFSGTLSGTFGTVSGTSLNLTRPCTSPHQSYSGLKTPLAYAVGE